MSAWVAGVDEAGRGPLAGPVVAAAVILDPRRPIVGLADSKALSPAMRAELVVQIRQHALCFGIGNATIGQRATDVAMHAAGQRNQAAGGGSRQPVAFDQRHAAPLPLEPAARHQTRQVAITRLTLA